MELNRKREFPVAAETNEALCQRIQQGDRAARLQLLQQNEGMIHMIAWRERRRYAYLTLEQEDLWAAGQMGLLRAARLFRAETGAQFVTYAWNHVRQAVQREIVSGGTMIRIPLYLHDRLHKISIYREPYSQVNYNVLAQRVTEEEQDGNGLTEMEVKECLCRVEPAAQMKSLNERVRADGGMERQDMVAAPKEEIPEEAVCQRMLLVQLLALLSDREREVIAMRFGLDGGEGMTLVEIGKRLHVTKERARQLEQRALKKMRAAGNA